MKRYVLLIIVLFTTHSLFSQVETVITNIYGEYEVIVSFPDNGYIVIDSYGKISDIHMKGNIDYYSDFFDYNAGKIKKIGNTAFSYYSDFFDYESGKIKKIGAVSFSYYSDFHDYESGKIKKIGNTTFTYYSNFNDYEAGKIKKIGNTAFSYYSNFNEYEGGKIKKIGNNNYTYFSDHRRSERELKSGKENFKDNGISFRIITKNRRPKRYR